MKKLFLLLVLGFFTINLFSQTSVSSDKRHVCIFQFETEEFTDCQLIEESSIFVFNKNETLFTHTTPEMRSTYYIKDKEVDGNSFMYEVVSDVGNEYLFVFDLEEELVIALFMSDYKEGDINTISVVWEIKAVF